MTYKENPAINFSTIKYLLDSEEAFFNNLCNPPKQTIAMRMGTALHGAVLENKSIDGFTEKQTTLINNMANAIKDYWYWTVNISNGDVEKEHYWQINGVDCKGIIDWRYQNELLLDLKSIANINFINEAIEKYKYKYQLAWYGMADNFQCNEYGLLFVDKTINHNVQEIIYTRNELRLYADKLYQVIDHYKAIKHKIITEF